MKTLIDELGVKFYVCASCVNHAGVTPENMIEGAEVKPGSYLGEMLMERQSLTF
jgi:predicted peroxiredoxin